MFFSIATIGNTATSVRLTVNSLSVVQKCQNCRNFQRSCQQKGTYLPVQFPGVPPRHHWRRVERIACGETGFERIRQLFANEGLELALSPHRTPRHEYRPKPDGEQRARRIRLARSPPPEGRVPWTLRLFAHALVELEVFHEAERHDAIKASSRSQLADGCYLIRAAV